MREETEEIRDVARQPVGEYVHIRYHCPACGERVGFIDLDSNEQLIDTYCHSCGQRLIAPPLMGK